MPRGKKELAIPFATSVEVEAYERSITVAAAHHHDSAEQCLGPPATPSVAGLVLEGKILT